MKFLSAICAYGCPHVDVFNGFVHFKLRHLSIVNEASRVEYGSRSVSAKVKEMLKRKQFHGHSSWQV